MENLLNNAKQFLGTEQGRNMESKFEQATGINVDQYLGGNNQGQQSGQQGQGQGQNQFQGGNQDQYNQNQNQGQGQFNQNQNQGGYDQNQGGSTDAFGNQGQDGQYGQQGQYGAVRGEGLGGALNQGQGQGGQGQSAYEGMGQDDSTSTGGYGGAAFSRKNQMGVDNYAQEDSDDGHGGGYATGTSTPGYRQEGDVDAEAAENRIRNQNLNTYGQQSNEANEKDDRYHEPNI